MTCVCHIDAPVDALSVIVSIEILCSVTAGCESQRRRNAKSHSACHQGCSFARLALRLYSRRLVLIVRSPFGAKHHVVVQYMARWLKCPLPPPPTPPPPPQPLKPLAPGPPQPPPPWKARRTRRNRRHYQQGTAHCSCLEHCFLFLLPQSVFCASTSSATQRQ